MHYISVLIYTSLPSLSISRRQGMSGMKTAGGGGFGRQVQDGSFFIGVLRSKMNDIRAEISRLRAEMERHEKDFSQQGHLERTYETMLQEVKGLEGTLADYNLAVDKARTTADPGEVAKSLHDLEDQNRCVFQIVTAELTTLWKFSYG